MTGSLGIVDSLFESVSGFTTTGSTVIADVTVFPRALLLWRAMSQWLGGMGIILFTIAILPLLGIGGMQLFKAEVPGPVADKVKPRLATTARTLWMVYVGFTAAECVALRLAGLSVVRRPLPLVHDSCHRGLFDAEHIGRRVRLAAGGVDHHLLHADGGNQLRSPFPAADGACQRGMARQRTAVLPRGDRGVDGGAHCHHPRSRRALADTFRNAVFQTLSILTTTGYASTDFELWASLPLLVLLCLMVLGGMSGSTGGGIKSLRALLAITSLRTTIHRLIHPHAVRPVKYGGTVVSESVLSGIWTFLTAYMLIGLIGAAVVAAHGYDVLTAISAGMTSIGNVGPGLGEVGAYDNFAHFPGLVKIVLAGCMLFGRLEVFTMLALFSREFWRR